MRAGAKLRAGPSAHNSRDMMVAFRDLQLNTCSRTISKTANRRAITSDRLMKVSTRRVRILTLNHPRDGPVHNRATTDEAGGGTALLLVAFYRIGRSSSIEYCT